MTCWIAECSIFQKKIWNILHSFLTLTTISADSWLWYLSVYKKTKLLFFFFFFFNSGHSSIWFSKQLCFQRLHSSKGSQLASDLAAGWTVYSFYSLLLACSLDQQKNSQQQKEKAAFPGEIWRASTPGFSGEIYLKDYQNELKIWTWSLFSCDKYLFTIPLCNNKKIKCSHTAHIVSSNVQSPFCRKLVASELFTFHIVQRIRHHMKMLSKQAVCHLICRILFHTSAWKWL